MWVQLERMVQCEANHRSRAGRVGEAGNTEGCTLRERGGGTNTVGVYIYILRERIGVEQG